MAFLENPNKVLTSLEVNNLHSLIHLSLFSTKLSFNIKELSDALFFFNKLILFLFFIYFDELLFCLTASEHIYMFNFK